MKKYLIINCLTLISLNIFAQKASVISVTLNNSPKLNIEKHHFFDRPKNSSEEVMTQEEFIGIMKAGEVHGENSKLFVRKTDDTHYTITQYLKTPEVIYLNYRPIHVTPGDTVSLTHMIISSDSDSFKDTIIASGKNKGNYEFSNFTSSKEFDKDYPLIGSAKYKGNVTGFHTDIWKYYTKYSKRMDSLLNKSKCSLELIDYVKRKKQEQLLINLTIYEDELLKNKNPQIKLYGKLLDDAFLSHNFVPSDTLHGMTMENVFKRYLSRLVRIKHNNLMNKADFTALLSEISMSNQAIVKDYLLYFLIRNYISSVKKYASLELNGYIDDIEDKRVQAQLEQFRI